MPVSPGRDASGKDGISRAQPGASLTTRHILRLKADINSALAAIHSSQMVHTDIHLGNIMSRYDPPRHSRGEHLSLGYGALGRGGDLPRPPHKEGPKPSRTVRGDYYRFPLARTKEMLGHKDGTPPRDYRPHSCHVMSMPNSDSWSRRPVWHSLHGHGLYLRKGAGSRRQSAQPFCCGIERETSLFHRPPSTAHATATAWATMMAASSLRTAGKSLVLPQLPAQHQGQLRPAHLHGGLPVLALQQPRWLPHRDGLAS